MSVKSVQMRSLLICGLFAALLIGGSIFPAMGQAIPFIADYVVINEIDVNPVGDDYAAVTEWVELFNPTAGPVHIGGWKIVSNNALTQALTITSGTIIDSKQYLLFSHQQGWFKDVGAIIILQNSDGDVVDQTPELTDTLNDNFSWQRIYDGHDSNSDSDWKLAKSTAATFNSELPTQVEEEQVGVIVSTDQTDYLWGQKATITGKVSERIYVEKPFFYPAPINMVITGPAGFHENRNLYPDLNLKYSTELTLSKIQEMTEGTYDIFVEYAGSTAVTKFSIGTPSTIIQEKVVGDILIVSDKPSYIPGENVVLLGTVPEIIPFEGMKYVVHSADGIVYTEGMLFPKEPGAGTSGAKGGTHNVDPNFLFSTSIFVDTAEPIYGEYRVDAEYAGFKTQTTFQVEEDVKEDISISLTTDLPAYGLGDTVIVSGRLNHIYDYTLNYNVYQTAQTALGIVSKTGFIYPGGINLFKIPNSSVRLEGDSTFKIEFKIPDNPQQYGDYRVEVWSSVGRATTFFGVLENPDEYVAQTELITLDTFRIPKGELTPIPEEETLFHPEDKILVKGKILEIKRRSSFETPTVLITVTTESGQPIGITTQAAKDIGPRAKSAFYTFTAIPDIGGNFAVAVSLARSSYGPGIYTVTANYDEGRAVTSTQVQITEFLDIGNSKIFASLDKSVYAPGEEVHLTGQIANTAQGGLQLQLLYPSGNKDTFGARIEDSQFSWSWVTPTHEQSQRKIDAVRAPVYSSNYGFYNLLINTESETVSLIFEVNPDPGAAALRPLEKVTVETDTPEYEVGDLMIVQGDVVKRVQGAPSISSLVVPERVHISIVSEDNPLDKKVEASVVPDNGGHYIFPFIMRVTEYEAGTYKVTTQYQKSFADTTIKVNNPFITSSDEPVHIDAKTDKEEYHPGETVFVFGKPSKVVYFKNVGIKVIKGDEKRLLCNTTFCKFQSGLITNVRPNDYGIFTYEYHIPDAAESIGEYKINADAGFRIPTDLFFKVTPTPDEEFKPRVSERGAEFELPERPGHQQRILPDELLLGPKKFEKGNRITESFYPLEVKEKSIDSYQSLPRVLQFSLFTPARDEYANVNIRVSTDLGQCVIGPESNCLVTDSTRAPGEIHKTVEINGEMYKVRYSGPDVVLEKFSILPENPKAILPDSTWIVEVIKNDQPHRLYYKITYVTTIGSAIGQITQPVQQ